MLVVGFELVLVVRVRFVIYKNLILLFDLVLYSSLMEIDFLVFVMVSVGVKEDFVGFMMLILRKRGGWIIKFGG